MSSEYTGFEIAIVGMSGRFPGSKNVHELWKNICEGKNLITYFNDFELRDNGVSEEYINDKNYVKARGILGDIDKFDAELFGFYPKEIELLDPQQRLFLECSWEAMEDAGYCPNNYPGLTGIFGGIGFNTYVLQSLHSNGNLKVSAEAYQLSIANDKDFLTTRVSYKLNMKGPSVNVQTACSTSLVATHIACMNLLNYQCDLALAGGSTISIPEVNGYHYQEGMILSPDGYCRPFDKDARGTVPSNGCGVVVLKRLIDAIEDKDDIYAVIKGSAYNNDGAIKVGYTAPGVHGQSEVLSSAYSMADIPLDTISYIETHGTGTSLGDPIEIDALTQVFNEENITKNSCAIGSVKSNIGHLDTAAGIAGLIKTALSVYHGIIPPSINFNSPNSKINFTNTPFYVNTSLKKWEPNGYPRRAGVSSFGIGGTNAHVVLEQAPPKEKMDETEGFRIVPFSAKTKKSLEQSIKSFQNFLMDSNLNLKDIAYTLQTGRKEFEFRKFSVVKNNKELLRNLSNLNSNKLIENSKIIDNPQIIFMFSGQGSQYINMCQDIYEKDSLFKKHFDDCCQTLKKEKDLDLRSIIYPLSQNDNNSAEILNQTVYTQPALFVIEYSLAMSFIELGLKPYSMVGHSIGEYVAACIAGVLDLRSALLLVTKRAELMQKLESGSMLSVNLSERELTNILPENLDLAVVNSPNMCVVSGEQDDINKFESYLNKKEIINTKLKTSHAFHSRMMNPILDEFKLFVSQINLKSPSIPYMSNVSGDFIKEAETIDPLYYVNHLRYTVRFSDNIKNLLNIDNAVFLEIGPGSTLTSLTKKNAGNNKPVVINTVRQRRHEIGDREMFLTAIGNLWLAGVKIDWEKITEDNSFRVHLPTYQFDKKRYWIKSKSAVNKETKATDDFKGNGNLIYEISWKRSASGQSLQEIDSENEIILFEDKDQRISGFLNQELKKNPIKVLPGEAFKKINDTTYYIDPSNGDDYQELLRNINNDNPSKLKFIHAWSISEQFQSKSKSVFDSYQEHGFISLSYLAKAITEINFQNKIELHVLSSKIFDILGNESIVPDKSTILGAVRVIRQEFPNIITTILEMEDNSANIQYLANYIYNGLYELKKSFTTAIRGNYSWQQIFNRLNLDFNPDNSLLKNGGTYLITGGLGRIGLVFAEHLAERYNANLILADRLELLPKDQWNNQSTQNDNPGLLSLRIKKLIEIDKTARNLRIVKTEVSRLDELKSCIENILSEFGNIDGIIHAAGIIGENMVKLVSDFNTDYFAVQTESKVYGTINIFEATKDLPLDFVLVQSSLASLLGGIGFSNYSAVNNFVDTYCTVTNSNLNGRTKWISVNWDGWTFSDDSNSNGINPAKGVEILDKILTKTSPSNIIVAADDLDNSIYKWIYNISENTEHDPLAKSNFSELHERPNLAIEYLKPESDIEKKICEEWEKLLGIRGIGINDNFFDLGGDSLIGTQLVSRLRKIYNTELPLVSVFENATVSGIASILEKEINSESEAKKVIDTLEKINNMSKEEISKMLREKK